MQATFLFSPAGFRVQGRTAACMHSACNTCILSLLFSQWNDNSEIKLYSIILNRTDRFIKKKNSFFISSTATFCSSIWVPLIMRFSSRGLFVDILWRHWVGESKFLGAANSQVNIGRARVFHEGEHFDNILFFPKQSRNGFVNITNKKLD